MTTEATTATTPHPARIATEHRERLLRAAFEAMDEGVVVQGAAGGILECNASALYLLGLSREQIDGRDARPPHWKASFEDGTLIPAGTNPVCAIVDRARAASYIVLAVDTGSRPTCWIKVHATPVRLSPDQSPHAFVATFTDISDQKDTERTLFETQARLARVIEGSREGVWELDPGTGHLYINERLAEMLGYSPTEIAPNAASLERLLHPDEARETMAAVDAMRLGTTSFEREVRFRHKEGRWVWFMVRGRAVEWNASGQPTRVSGTMTDVTVRRRAQEAVRLSEARLRGYFQTPTVGVVIVGTDHTYLEVNDFFCSLLGYAREELIGRRWQELTHPEEGRLQQGPLDELVAGTRDSFSLEKRYIRRDGTTIWAHTSASIVRAASGEVDCIVAIIHDITLRKQAEEAVLHALADHESDVERREREGQA